jgi:hypothetical protein
MFPPQLAAHYCERIFVRFSDSSLVVANNEAGLEVNTERTTSGVHPHPMKV